MGKTSNSEPNPISVASGLDSAHRQLLQRLCEREEWDRHTVAVFCKQIGLMLDGALETLNEWAVQNHHQDILENDDPIIFYTQFAEGIMNG